MQTLQETGISYPFPSYDSELLVDATERNVDNQALYRTQNTLAEDQWGTFQELDLEEISGEDADLSQRESEFDLSTQEAAQDIQELDPRQTPDTTFRNDADSDPLDSLDEYKDADSTDELLPDISSSESAVSGASLQDKGEDIMSDLSLLHLQYQQSVSSLASLPPPDPVVPVSAVSSETDTTQVKEVQAEYTMSKNQDQLTMEEGRFWDQLVESSQKVEDPEAMELVINGLAQRSGALFESYNRRTNPPTMETYEECKEILNAMGIPCIDSEGAFEAEALASSLVINGLADYVASEDTVRPIDALMPLLY